MQNFLNIYYTIFCTTFFCIFNQIVILIKHTKIYAAENTVAKMNIQTIVTQKFFAQKFCHKNCCCKNKSSKNFVGLFLQHYFLHQIFLHYNCLCHKYLYIYF